MTPTELQPSKSSPIREQIAGRLLRPFERLDTGPLKSANETVASADRLVESATFRLGPFKCNIVPPIDFDAHNRSCAFHSHAWDAVSLLLLAYDANSEDRYLEAALAIANDWMVQHQLRLLEMPRDEALAYALGHTETQAWYDMGVGQRIYRMAYLVDVIARLPDRCSDKEFEHYWESLTFHHRLLSQEKFFKGHNNHGLYQALGQMAAARRFDFLPEVRTYE